VQATSTDEIGQLAQAFNRMTHELVDQRERLVQAERVAAWRELARRLAHELKNPLFPLQITVENMQRARESYPDQFDEVFREGAATLLAELANLKRIIGNFSDFAKMPAPEAQAVNLSELAAATLKLFEPQLAREHIAAKRELDPNVRPVQADPEQITRALRNLILNAIDAMPEGGTLTVRTAAVGQGVRIEVADTGKGLTPEECARLFTPYYTTKQHGTGLGLAIVQSIVSDHKGRISVESAPGKGTAFRIELE
jgi:nitrogen fixation/metabolism regulation signal transduction histidine kinase